MQWRKTRDEDIPRNESDSDTWAYQEFKQGRERLLIAFTCKNADQVSFYLKDST